MYKSKLTLGGALEVYLSGGTVEEALAAAFAAAGVELAPEPPAKPGWWDKEVPERGDQDPLQTLVRSHNARVRGLRATEKALGGNHPGSLWSRLLRIERLLRGEEADG